MQGKPTPRLRGHLHVGMHKTGTTAIQETLSRADLGSCRYLFPRPPNFSGRYATLFEDRPWRHVSNWVERRSRADVEARRLSLAQQLERGLAEAAADPAIDAVLLSGERMSAAQGPEPVARLQAALAPWCTEVRVHGYVRAPVAFMESYFLQGLKARASVRLTLAPFWPRYRARFERFDTLFGPEAVDLRRYDPAAFPGGDVVRDVAPRLGLDPGRVEALPAVRPNPALRLEAAALLFALRRTERFHPRRPEGVAGALRLAEALAPLGTRRFRAAPELVADLMDRHAGDLRWMEDRLGQPLADAPAPDGIRDEADLLAVAAGARDLLEAVEGPLPPGADGAPLTPRALRALLEEGLRGEA